MPSTTTYRRGQVVVVTVPFTGQGGKISEASTRPSAAPEAVAERLKDHGYVSVSGFEVAKRGSRRDVFRPAPDAL